MCGCFGSCAEPPAAKVKLTLLGFGLDAGGLLRQDALDEFTRSTGISVELIPTPGTSAQQLSVSMDLLKKRSSSPDVYLVDTVWPGTLHEYLDDLRPHMGAEAREHNAALLENNTIAGKVVCLPFYMNSGMLYYRPDLLKRYGYSQPPGTWDELESAAKKIQQGERAKGNRNFAGFVWQGAAYEGLTCNALEWQMSFGGGRVIEADGRVNVNNAGMSNAMRSAARWVGSISPKGVLAYTESDSIAVFRAGGAAFMRHWSSAYGSLARDMESGTVGVALLPAGPNGRAQAVGGFHLGVSRYSQHKREAVQLVLHLTSKEVQKRRALRRSFLPTYPDLYRDAEFVRAVPAGGVLKELPAESWAVRPSSVAAGKYADVSQAYYKGVHAILAGEAKVEAGLAEIERSLQAVMKGGHGAAAGENREVRR